MSFLYYANNVSYNFVGTELLRYYHKGLMREIKNNYKVSNILNGPFFPVVLLKISPARSIGQVVRDCFNKLEKTLSLVYGQSEIVNNLRGRLIGRVSVCGESRYQHVTRALRKNYVIGLYFPDAFRGSSVEAQRKQINLLPRGFSLSGHCLFSAIMMYPEFWLNNAHLPGFDLSAFTWYDSNEQYPGKSSLSLKIINKRIILDKIDCLSLPYAMFSGGIFYTNYML